MSKSVDLTFRLYSAAFLKGSELKSKQLTRRLPKQALALTMMFLLSAATAAADPLQLALGGVQDQPGDNSQDQAPQISQRRALELVRERFPGNVVSINQVQQGGVLQYRVRMDNEGNIYTVYVHASSGAITREQ